ncbi:MAG: putative ABC transporter ATP-binding protein [Candidatus Peregrinibacteria bacterium Greene0416_19]|nr:MAG: putative ABC transporter ATP-binding protein [Candidatus Peregrinibacteria bacterium Greene0416_19]
MWNILASYLPSVRKERRWLVGSIVTLIGSALIDAYVPYVIRRLVAILADPSPQIAAIDGHFLWLAVLLISGVAGWRLFETCLSFLEARVMRDLDLRCFAALQRQSLRFFESSFTGSLVKQATRYRKGFEGLADILFYNLGRDLILLLIILGIFFSEQPLLAWIFLGWSVVFIGMSALGAWWKYPLDAKEAESDSKVGAVLSDSLGNHGTVKSYAREDEEAHLFEGAVEKNYRLRIRSWMWSNGISAVQGVMMTGFQLIVIWLMIRGWKQGTVSVADFVFFQSYVLWLCGNLWNFGHSLRRAFQFIADGAEMVAVFTQETDVQDAPEAADLTVHAGSINFQRVGFSYMNSRRRQVHDFSLSIAPGESIGLVGASGAGKSTLVKLLLRHANLDEGSIAIDGQDIAGVTQRSLRRSIAVVPQQPDLFHRTLRQNIAFGRPDATEEEIIAAAKRAHAWEFIVKQEHGLDTMVGERGIKLSGGERQRIALARAFLADCPILILDEATSALDSETESLIQAAIADLLKNRTSIVIAHRLSTVMRLDRIVVLDHGRIVETGTHDDLITQKGVYTSFWNKQSGGYIATE